MHVTLANLPRITDSSLHHISMYCPNLEGLDLTNSHQISEVGVRSVLYACPFVCMLDLSRLGDGVSNYGYAANEKIIPYILAYGMSLKYLSVAGCQLNLDQIAKLITGMPSVMTWGVGFAQIGNRNIDMIKQVICSWMGSKFTSMVPIQEFAITACFENKKKLHIIGTKFEQTSRYFISAGVLSVSGVEGHL
jgi:hypothetical protein